jgi:SAM-dependent methyltransferase
MIHSGSRAIKAYYKHRAPQYDRIYEIPARRADLSRLRAWVTRHVKGKTVFEIAAGTGYWTQVCSRSAKWVVATDFNVDTLIVAAGRRFGSRVSFVAADAFLLPAFKIKFEVGVAFLWWSHMRKQERSKFVAHLLSRLAPGAKLLLIDEVYGRGMAKNSISKHDQLGNRYELRVTSNNVMYEIVKNLPGNSALRRTLSDCCNEVRVRRLRHFWAVSARAKML